MAVNVDFNEVLEQLKNGILELAKTTVGNYIKDAKADGKNLLARMQDDLERWTKLLIAGSLTTEEFEWLVNSQRGTIQMAALEKAGLAKIRIDQFTGSVLNLIVDTVLGLVKI